MSSKSSLSFYLSHPSSHGECSFTSPHTPDSDVCLQSHGSKGVLAEILEIKIITFYFEVFVLGLSLFWQKADSLLTTLPRLLADALCDKWTPSNKIREQVVIQGKLEKPHRTWLWNLIGFSSFSHFQTTITNSWIKFKICLGEEVWVRPTRPAVRDCFRWCANFLLIHVEQLHCWSELWFWLVSFARGSSEALLLVSSSLCLRRPDGEW